MLTVGDSYKSCKIIGGRLGNKKLLSIVAGHNSTF